MSSSNGDRREGRPPGLVPRVLTSRLSSAFTTNIGKRRGAICLPLAVVGLTTAAATPVAGQQASLDEVQAADRICLSCHGESRNGHPVDVPALRASAHGATVTCGECHTNAHDGSALDPMHAEWRPADVCTQCHAGVHPSHAETALGTTLCTTCHAVHSDPPLPGAGPIISERCAACHAKPMADFKAGEHAAGLAHDDPNEDLPNCVTCHADHPAPGDVFGDARLAATVRCMECHSQDLLASKYGLQKVGESYARDFHGATLQFLWRHPAGEGQPDVMVCSDCHGAHQVGWLESEAVAGVCLGCHEEADVRFAGAWLGHDPLGPENGVLVWMVRLFYYALIPLVVGGLLINILFHLRDQRRRGARALEALGVTNGKGKKRPKEVREPVRIIRFSLTERGEHLAAIVLFTLLVVTGLPQTGPTSALGNWFVDLWGGIASTRLIHRAAGLSFVAVLVLHVGRGVIGAVRRRRLPAIMLRKRDFADASQTLRHYLRGAPRPKAGKFDFREKFEYWGLFLGGTLMTVTGLILLFPELASQVIPGALLAAARTAHGLEATFAVLVIVVWHSYGVIFRPEIFPLDTTMFTGKISLERLREEHELHYEEIFPHGVMPREGEALEQRPDEAEPVLT